MFRYLGEKIPIPMSDADVWLNCDECRCREIASMPASYIANYIYCTIANV